MVKHPQHSFSLFIVAVLIGLLLPVAATADEYTISDRIRSPVSIRSADLDGDGDLDALGASYYGDEFLWWENLAGDASSWIERPVIDGLNSASSAEAADIDGDGDLDILGTAESDYDVVWAENLYGDGSTWVEHTIESSAYLVYTAQAGDFDGDGDLDVVVGDRLGNDEILWYENLTGDGSQFNANSDVIIDGGSFLRSSDIFSSFILGKKVQSNRAYIDTYVEISVFS